MTLKTQISKVSHYKNELLFAILFATGVNIFSVQYHYNYPQHISSITILFALMLLWVKAIMKNSKSEFRSLTYIAVGISYLIMVGALYLGDYKWTEDLILSFILLESSIYLVLLRKLHTKKLQMKPIIVIPVTLSILFVTYVLKESAVFTTLLAIPTFIITNLLFLYSYNLKDRSLVLILGLIMISMSHGTGAIKQFVGDFPMEYSFTTIFFYLGRVVFLKSMNDDLVANATSYSNKRLLLKTR